MAITIGTHYNVQLVCLLHFSYEKLSFCPCKNNAIIYEISPSGITISATYFRKKISISHSSFKN